MADAQATFSLLEQIHTIGYRCKLTIYDGLWHLKIDGIAGRRRKPLRWAGTNPADLVAQAAKVFIGKVEDPDAELPYFYLREAVEAEQPKPPPEPEETCTKKNKRRYASEAIAEAKAVHLSRCNLKKSRARGRTGVRPYSCDDCGGWHLTSQSVEKFLENKPQEKTDGKTSD